MFRITIQTVILRIIQRGFDIGRFIQQFFPKLRYVAGQSALQLPEGRIQRSGILCRDHVHDGFRFRKIDPSAEKGSLRKLSGFCQPGSR